MKTILIKDLSDEQLLETMLLNDNVKNGLIGYVHITGTNQPSFTFNGISNYYKIVEGPTHIHIYTANDHHMVSYLRGDYPATITKILEGNGGTYSSAFDKYRWG